MIGYRHFMGMFLVVVLLFCSGCHPARSSGSIGQSEKAAWTEPQELMRMPPFAAYFSSVPLAFGEDGVLHAFLNQDGGEELEIVHASKNEFDSAWMISKPITSSGQNIIGWALDAVAEENRVHLLYRPETLLPDCGWVNGDEFHAVGSPANDGLPCSKQFVKTPSGELWLAVLSEDWRRESSSLSIRKWMSHEERWEDETEIPVSEAHTFYATAGPDGKVVVAVISRGELQIYGFRGNMYRRIAGRNLPTKDLRNYSRLLSFSCFGQDEGLIVWTDYIGDGNSGPVWWSVFKGTKIESPRMLMQQAFVPCVSAVDGSGKVHLMLKGPVEDPSHAMQHFVYSDKSLLEQEPPPLVWVLGLTSDSGGALHALGLVLNSASSRNEPELALCYTHWAMSGEAGVQSGHGGR
jgi:hypothetical protein